MAHRENNINHNLWEGLTTCHWNCRNLQNFQTCDAICLSAFTMRLVSVCVCGEWVRVPRGQSSASVHTLATDALRRYYQTKGDKDGEKRTRFSVQRCGGGEILLPDNRVEDVLQDNDFVR